MALVKLIVLNSKYADALLYPIMILAAIHVTPVRFMQMAFYAADPVTGNSLGFQPSSLLHPRDAFEVGKPLPSNALLVVFSQKTTVSQMFDTDNSGEIDEDEFGLLLEYMGIELSEAEMERLFKRFDTVRAHLSCFLERYCDISR